MCPVIKLRCTHHGTDVHASSANLYVPLWFEFPHKEH